MVPSQLPDTNVSLFGLNAKLDTFEMCCLN